jgi:DnaJ-class molecular chaperone
MADVKATQSETAELTCSFCGGSGTDPFGIMSWASKCCVCGGSGMVRMTVPYTRCAHCGGTGAVKTFTCTACMGKGYVPRPKEPIRTCPDCYGSGDDPSAPAMYCLTCRGSGFVASSSE